MQQPCALHAARFAALLVPLLAAAPYGASALATGVQHTREGQLPAVGDSPPPPGLLPGAAGIPMPPASLGLGVAPPSTAAPSIEEILRQATGLKDVTGLRLPQGPQVPVAAVPPGHVPVAAVFPGAAAMAPTPGAVPVAAVFPGAAAMAPSPGMMPAPAPQAALLPPPVTPPPLGALVNEARNRLRGDHMQLSSVSQDLLQVQNQMFDTEQSIFGRVLNVETVRSLYSQHEQVDAMNERLRREVQALQTQVVQLSKELAEAHLAQLHDEELHQARQVNMVSFISEGNSEVHRKMQLRASQAARVKRQQAETARLQAEKVANFQRRANQMVVQMPYDQAQNAMLKMERQQLLNQSAVASYQTQASIQALLPLRQALALEEATQIPLRMQVVALHQNSTQCHGIAGELENTLKFEQNSLPAELEASASARKQADTARAAGSQRLKAEGAILSDQVRKADGTSKSSMEMLKQSQERLNLIETKIIEGIHTFLDRKNATLMHIQEVNRSIIDNQAAKIVAMEHKHDVEGRVINMSSILTPIKYTTIRTQNEVMASELDNAKTMLVQAQTGQALATTTVDQLTGEFSALQTQAEDSSVSLRQAREEGTKQIELAIQESEAGKKKATDLIQQASDTLEQKCFEKWEKRMKQTTDDITKCEEKKGQLAIVTAQRDTLEQTLQSQQAAG